MDLRLNLVVLNYKETKLEEIVYKKLLGHGGQGEVWEGILFKQSVAIKKLTNSHQRENFEREISYAR